MSKEKLPLYNSYIIYDMNTGLYSEQSYPVPFEGEGVGVDEIKKELKGIMKDWKSRENITSKEAKERIDWSQFGEEGI